MADIGVLPTRTGVNITSSNGQNGTIPAATPKAAGCMSADQAQQLDALWRASLTSDQGPAPIVIERPAQRPVDVVSRSELRAAIAEVSRAVAANPLTPIADDSLPARMAAIEARQDQLEHRLVAFAEIVDQVCKMVDQLDSGQKFIEQHAVAQIGVRQ